MTRQSFAQLEAAEERGSAGIASLRRAADAMDCDLVYYLVPKAAKGRSFSDLADARSPDAAHERATERSFSLEGRGEAEHGT